MELIKDMSIANRYTDEQRPMTVEEWEIAKGMYQRATETLRDLILRSENETDLTNKIRHINAFEMINQEDFNEQLCDYLDIRYTEDNSQSVEYIVVTVGIQSILNYFNVAIKHLDYEYEDLALHQNTTIIE